MIGSRQLGFCAKEFLDLRANCLLDMLTTELEHFQQTILFWFREYYTVYALTGGERLRGFALNSRVDSKSCRAREDGRV